MALAGQALLDYVAEHPGAGREEIRRHVAPAGEYGDGLARPQAARRRGATRRVGARPRHRLPPRRPERGTRPPANALAPAPAGDLQPGVHRSLRSGQGVLHRGDGTAAPARRRAARAVPAAGGDLCAPDPGAASRGSVLGVFADGGQHLRHPGDRTADPFRARGFREGPQGSHHDSSTTRKRFSTSSTISPRSPSAGGTSSTSTPCSRTACSRTPPWRGDCGA